MKLARILAVLLTTWIVVGISGVAHADNAAAEALFQEGKRLADAGDWHAACPKFQGSFKLDEQLGTLLNLADCLEKDGQLAASWAAFNRAITWAQRNGDGRLDWIKERQAAITARLPKLTVVVSRSAPGLTVWRDGSPVVRESYGVALLVDPGERVIEIRRGEKLLETKKVLLKEAEQRELSLDLAAVAAAHPAAVRPPPPAPPKPPPVVAPEPYDATQRNVGLIVGAVGVAAVLVAGGLELAALIKKGEADASDACVNKLCSPQGLAAAEQGATFAEAGQWTGIAGLVTLAIGATVFFTAPSEPDEGAAATASVALAPWASPNSGGLTVHGSF